MTLTAPREPLSARDYMVYPPAPSEVAQLSEELSISPVLAQILVNRGFRDVESAEAFLLGGHESLLEPELLEGIAEAADLASEAVRRGHKIMVHGDYDADGVSGTALLVAFLRDIGADVVPYIPHRIDEGYGLSAEGARKAAELGVDLMISVDCGSSSPRVVELAQSLGVRVIVTDHHMVTTPPPADAFVNPRAPGSAYPFPHLSGAGVAFKLVQAMTRRLGCGQAEDYLDLAAIGTVGDVVPLVGENRILVREGLAVMERLERPGIAALARVAGLLERDGEARVSARDVAFEIAPRINACGRLEHAMQAALLLLETDPEKAEALAHEVDALNQQRRDLCASILEAAEAQVEARGVEGWNVIVEAHEAWHQGIVGITANKLLDKYGLPSLVISVADDGTAKGSARAPAHIDLFACLTRCADLFTHYGGHPRAGGFSLPADGIDALRERMHDIVPSVAGPPEPALRVDLELPLAAVDLTLLEELESLAPVGQGNPSPLFLARGVRVRYPDKLKDRHWRFQAVQGEASARCISFNLVHRLPDLRDGDVFDMIYEVEPDHFRGEARVSFKVKDLVPVPGRSRRAADAPRGARPAEAPRTPVEPDVRSAEARRAPADAPHVPPAQAPRAPDADPDVQPLDAQPAGWTVEDARAHENHGRYLADVVAEGRPTVVLCRRDHVGWVTRLLAAGAPQPPPNVRIGAYGADLPTTDAVEWVLFTPPPSLASLAPLRGGAGGRCHVAFGRKALDEEGRLIEAVAMDRDRLMRVYKLFKAGANAQGTFDESHFSRLLEESRQYDLRIESLRVGLRIMSEMGVVEGFPGVKGRYRFTGQRAELESSPTYQRYAGLAQAFAAVADLFGREDGGLGERLLPVLRREES